MKDFTIKKYIKRILIVLFWLAVWEIVSLLVNNAIVIAGPFETINKTCKLFCDKDFYPAVYYSFCRISGGFFLGLILGILFAVLAYKMKLFEEIFMPFIAVIKSVPVASFVVLMLIWMGSDKLPLIISFMVVFPNIYLNMLKGLESVDKELLEMAEVFKMPYFNRIFYIYMPGIRPFLYSSMQICLGMCFKSGVAAEVIAVPTKAIGERLYMSKIYLDTAGVLAYTIVIIIISFLFEKMVMYIADGIFAYEPLCKKSVCKNSDAEVKNIHLSGVCKSYQNKNVLDNVEMIYEAAKTYYLTSPSGSGKSTLLKIIAGIVKADCGELSPNLKTAMLFQEDRLVNDYSAIKNVAMVTGNEKGAEEALLKLLTKKDIYCPVKELSGGMKRRVAITRAVEAESDLLLLDEPFTGQDKDTIEKVKQYIADNQRGRIVIIASHITE